MASRDEMPFSADNLRFFAGAARQLEGKSAGEYIKVHVDDPTRADRIVAGICPWNYPLMMAVWKMGLRSRPQRADPEAVRADARCRCWRFMELAKDVIPEACCRSDRRRVPTGQRLVEHPTSASSPDGRRRDRQANRPQTPPTRSSACISSSAQGADG